MGVGHELLGYLGHTDLVLFEFVADGYCGIIGYGDDSGCEYDALCLI